MFGSALLMIVAFSGFRAHTSQGVFVPDAPLLHTSNASSLPAFHQVLPNSPSVASFLLSNQIQSQSKVSSGVIYTRQRPGAEAENAIAQVLHETMPKFDKRFGEGVSAD